MIRPAPRWTGRELQGSLKIGIPDDHSREKLSSIIADFVRDHPKVELTVHCALSTGFSRQLVKGDLDLAVHEVETVAKDMVLLRREPLVWSISRQHSLLESDPLPVALFDRACWWRDAALQSLLESGRPYRVVYSSESVTGVAAAIEAGIAVGVLGLSDLPGGLRALAPEEGFAAVPDSQLAIEFGRDARDPLCAAMSRAIQRAFGTPQKNPRR